MTYCMHCPDCGLEIYEKNMVCPYCGSRLYIKQAELPDVQINLLDGQYP